MSYEKFYPNGWQSGETGGTPVTPEALNHMEKGIENSLPAIESDVHAGCYYLIIDGLEEWLNPPMSLGTTYRTTERYQGKVVYARLVNFGALPNNTSKTVAYCSSGSTGAVSLTAMLSDGCVIHGGVGRDLNLYTSSSITLDCTRYNIRIRTDADFSSLTAYVLIKYTLD